MQARLPPALAALHNFIQKHDPDDITTFDSVEDSQPGTRAEGSAAAGGELAEGLPGAAEKRQANDRRARIAREMWTQYQAVLSERNTDE